jgi:hypothetical protein
VLPSTILKVTDKIKADSKGEEDFPLISFESTLSGSLEKQGDVYFFSARASGQKYALKSAEPLKAQIAAGQLKLTLTGNVSEEKGKCPVLDVTAAKATPQ